MEGTKQRKFRETKVATVCRTKYWRKLSCTEKESNNPQSVSFECSVEYLSAQACKKTVQIWKKNYPKGLEMTMSTWGQELSTSHSEKPNSQSEDQEVLASVVGNN